VGDLTDLSDLWARRDSGDGDARRTLIEHYRPLCGRVARRVGVVPTPALGRDDLEAAGLIGLIQAVDRFCTDRGVPFEGFAALRIRGAILDEVRRLDDLSRDARRRMNQDGEGRATSVSLELLVERGAGPDAAAAEVDERTAREGLRDEVERALATIAPRERSIIASYYGDGSSFSTIGRRLGVSEARVSQLHSRAIAQLRMLLGVAGVPKVRAARAVA